MINVSAMEHFLTSISSSRGLGPPLAWMRKLVDIVLPARCLACGCIIEQQGALCTGCWSDVRFVAGAVCRYCGLPLGETSAVEPLCDRCSDEPPSYETARAPLRYEATGRRLILAFKHRDRIEGTRTFAQWMVSSGETMLSEDSVLVPVPLHRWRLLARGYNQSALLAREIARITGVEFLPDSLRRVRRTASQQGLGARERMENVTAAAFAMSAGDSERIRDRAVVIIDDVLTTGATVRACAAVLRRAGARRVDVLTLARVVHEEIAPI